MKKAILVALIACSNPDKELSADRALLDSAARLCASISRTDAAEVSLRGSVANPGRYSDCMKGLSDAQRAHSAACQRFFDPYTCQREQDDIVKRATSR